MLIKREQMWLEQTHRPTSSEKTKRLKNKQTTKQGKKRNVQLVFRRAWENGKESGKAGGWLEERRRRPPLWAWIITPTFNRAYGTLDNIILQVQDQISFTLFEYIDFFYLHFLKTYTSMYIKLYKKQGITSIVPI